MLMIFILQSLNIEKWKNLKKIENIQVNSYY